MTEELFCQIAFTLIPSVGSVKAKKLLEFYNNPQDLFQETPNALKTLFGANQEVISAIRNKSMFPLAEKEIAFIEKYKIKTFFYTSHDFPERLKQSECIDSPVLLYFKGTADLNKKKILSIVGTRKATAYGKTIVDELMNDLKDDDVFIVSGLAYGIDTFAHKAALQHNLSTVGVLAHGLDNIYPAQNKKMAIEMLERGGLLTELISETKMHPHMFPARNRIIAGLADATIVVEAAQKGGALITAQIANSYNREVFAVPGNLNEAASQGCNFLIKTNRATLLQNASDIRMLLNWNKAKQTKNTQQKLFLELSAEEQPVYSIIQKLGTCSIDEICTAIEYSPSELAGILIGMELKNTIQCLPGKRYCIQ